MLFKKSNRARIYYTKQKKCAARWQFLLVRTNYLIEKRNRIFLVSAMMWWWSSTLNVTMHQLQRGLPTSPTDSHELTNTIHSTNRHRTNPETINNQILVKINLALWIPTTDDDDWALLCGFLNVLSPLMNEQIRTLADELGWCGLMMMTTDVDGWMMMVLNLIGLTKQTPKTPAIQDDADGHLIYHTNDILHNRCSW